MGQERPGPGSGPSRARLSPPERRARAFRESTPPQGSLSFRRRRHEQHARPRHPVPLAPAVDDHPSIRQRLQLPADASPRPVEAVRRRTDRHIRSCPEVIPPQLHRDQLSSPRRIRHVPRVRHRRVLRRASDESDEQGHHDSHRLRIAGGSTLLRRPALSRGISTEGLSRRADSVPRPTMTATATRAMKRIADPTRNRSRSSQRRAPSPERRHAHTPRFTPRDGNAHVPERNHVPADTEEPPRGIEGEPSRPSSCRAGSPARRSNGIRLRPFPRAPIPC